MLVVPLGAAKTSGRGSTLLLCRIPNRFSDPDGARPVLRAGSAGQLSGAVENKT
jgi:hypothetical protein